jgi:hypothetical protein
MSSWGFLIVISSSWNKAVGSTPEISLNSYFSWQAQLLEHDALTPKTQA